MSCLTSDRGCACEARQAITPTSRKQSCRIINHVPNSILALTASDPEVLLSISLAKQVQYVRQHLRSRQTFHHSSHRSKLHQGISLYILKSCCAIHLHGHFGLSSGQSYPYQLFSCFLGQNQGAHGYGQSSGFFGQYHLGSQAEQSSSSFFGQ